MTGKSTYRTYLTVGRAGLGNVRKKGGKGIMSAKTSRGKADRKCRKGSKAGG